MCGLVGVFGNLLRPHVEYFEKALIADYFRGKHSTGITTVQGNNIFNKKLCLDPINFLQLKDVDDNITVMKKLIMGHNRHATMGGTNTANAHPFQHGDITLMHNGTLSNKYQLEKTYDAPTFGTDSELICWLLDNYEENVVEDLEGAFALTWWDSGTDTFNVIRNDERPLSFTFHEDVLIYASEKEMMEWLLFRKNLYGTPLVSPNVVKPMDCKVGTQYTFKYEQGKLSVKTTERSLAVKKPVASSTTTNVSNINRGGTGASPRQQFNEEKGTNLSVGDTVYAYLDTFSPQGANIETHYQLGGTSVEEPWYEVRAYGVRNLNEEMLVAAGWIKGTVSGFSVGGRSKAVLLEAGSIVLIRDTDDGYMKIIEDIMDDNISETQQVKMLPPPSM